MRRRSAGVRLPVNVVPDLEAVEDGVDVVAVETEAPAEFGLAERPVLLQCGQDSEIGAGAERHASGGYGAEVGSQDTGS